MTSPITEVGAWTSARSLEARPRILMPARGRLKLLVGMLGLAMLLAACDSGPQSYDGPEQVVSALSEEGITCDDLDVRSGSELTQDERPSLVKERGSCSVGSEQVTIVTFADEGDRDDWIAVGQLLGPVAVGPDWVVTSRSSDLVRDIADRTGASVR